jgi:hypothetical protein
MSDSGSPKSVTTRELLDIRNEQWRSALDKVSFVAEVLDGILPEDRVQALDCLGRVLNQSAVREHPRILRRWPAVHVVATTGVAADYYVSGTFWPHLLDVLGVRGLQNFQSIWGLAFLDNLGRLGLPTFNDSDDAGTRYVGRILMHCGMPTLCLPEYFGLVSDQRSRQPGLTPESFVSWATGRADRGQLHNVAKPVSRFLHYGGDYAVDVTARVFDLLDAVVGGSDGADAGLPERFQTVARSMGAKGLVHGASRTSVTGSATAADQQPRIVLEPFGLGVVLRLPGVDAGLGRSVEWVVDADGERQRVSTRARLAGFEESAPPTDVPLSRPARAVAAALAGREDLTASILVVDDTAPLLAFDENGELRAPGLPLHGRPMWLLFPGTPDELRVEGADKVLTESPLPPGWSGWCLLLVDLDDAQSVRVGDDGARRGVRRHSSARVATTEPVPGVRTAQGRPVHAELPTISLPQDLSSADWDVSLLDERDEVVTRWRSGTHGGDPQALWDQISRPLVGSYTVRVRGPWGRGTRRSFDIVEGLSVSYSPKWRRFSAGGLQPCTARVAAAPEVTLTQDLLRLAGNEREALLRAGAHDTWLSLVVVPPHMTVAYQTQGASLPPSIRPLTLFQEEVVTDAGQLVLGVGDVAEPRLHYLVSGSPVQTIEPGSGRNGVYPFNLARLTDTLAVHPKGVLSLDPDGGLIIGHIRPQKLFSDIMLLGRAVELSEVVAVEGLTAVVYAAHAPWLPPASVAVVDGRVDLPAHLQDAGPLLVLVRIEDPWMPQEIPEWPAPGEAWLLEGFGHVITDNPQLTRLSAFLSGDQALSEEVTEFKALWTTRGLISRLGLATRRAEITERLDQVLNSHPREALLAVSESRASIDVIPSMLVRSGLVWADLTDAHDDAPPLWSTRNAMAATLLSAADAGWSADEIEAAVEVCGDVLTELLGGKDKAAQAGRLDQGSQAFDAQPQIREQFVREMGLVPAGLLSEDSRVLAVMEYVKNRRDPRLERLARNAHLVLESCTKLLAYLKDPVADAAVAARRPPDTTGGWRVIPTISLTYAFAARHAVRGNHAAATWLADRQRNAWSSIAEVAPGMVTTDIILAELLVSSTTTSSEGTP